MNEKLLAGLNSAQTLAVKTITGPVMVMAGAGAGKTRVLTHRIAYIIAETGVSPYNILAVTFTNKAANEMKERVANLIDFDAKYMWISTFHSFCARLLRLEIDGNLEPYRHNFTIIDDEDSLKIVKTILKEEDLDEFKAKDIRDYISNVKNIASYSIKDPYRKAVFEKVEKLYNGYLEDNNMMDFDDLIIKTIELFKHNPPILEKYQEKFNYILVDEFQDTNDLQYKLIYMLAIRHQNIFVVGDDFQSIYSFRGAKIENINRFQNDFLNVKLILLEENYRSTNQILSLANQIIEHNPNQIKKELYTKKDDGSLPIFYQAANEKAEATYVVDKIKELYLSGDRYQDFAIIYRSNHISRIFEDKLIFYKIPYRIYGGLSFFARKEIKDIIAYLRVIINPNDDFSFSRIVNEPKRKIGPSLLEKLANYANHEDLSLFEAIPTFVSSGIGAQALQNFYKTITSIFAQIDNIKLTDIIDLILEETGYKAMLEAEEDDYERLDNIYEFKNVLKEVDENSHDDNLTKLEKLLDDLSLRTDEEKKSDEDCVILTTYHQAKGLEFKNVFLVAMEEGIFPSEYHLEDLDMEEERRICYVGITRAMERLYITCAKSRYLYGNYNNGSPSRFIDEMGKNNIKNVSDGFIKKTAFNYKEYLAKQKEIQKTISNDTYNVGDKIDHNKFGVGIVVSIGTDNTIKVAFKAPIGVKTLIQNHPSFKVIKS